MLRSELQALRNLTRTAEGRSALLAQTIVLACVMMASFGMTSFLLHRELLGALRDDASGTALATVYGLVAALPAAFALATGLPVAGRELYLGNHVPLLLCAPVTSLQIVVRAWLRIWFGWTLFALAFVLPPAIGLWLAGGLPAVSVLGLVLVTPMLIVPVVAVLMLAQASIVRWCSGPRLRLAVMVVQITVAGGTVLAMLFGLVRGRAIGEFLTPRLQEATAVSTLLVGPAALPAALAGYPQPLLAWAVLPAGLAAAALLVGITALFYRRSFEAHLLAGAERAVRVRSRSWPVHPVRSLLAKATAESVRVRGNLVFFAFLCVILVGWLATDSVGSPPEDGVPRTVREVFFVLQHWQMVSLFLAMILFLGVLGGEQKQISLLATAPVSRLDILRSRRILLGWPFAATLLVAALAAPLVTDVSATGAFGFALAAPPLLLATLGCLLPIGSWPSMIRVHDDTPLASNLRTSVPSLLVGAAGVAGLILHAMVRKELMWSYRRGDGDVLAAGCLVAAWIAGLAVFWIGDRIARSNFERLLGAQPR